MKRNTRRWNEDVGSLDFMQVIIGLLIVGIAAVGTFQALNYGNDHLNFQMRYRNATSIARSHLEYWQGRIHTDMPVMDREWAGNLGQIVDPTLLDEGDPNKVGDEVYCYVRYGRILPQYNVLLGNDKNGTPLISHYVIRVQVTWWEPGESTNLIPHEVNLQGTMVPAAL